jgi:hypothetical protein
MSEGGSLFFQITYARSSGVKNLAVLGKSTKTTVVDCSQKRVGRKKKTRTKQSHKSNNNSDKSFDNLACKTSLSAVK